MNDILTGKTEEHLTRGFSGFLFNQKASSALEILSKRAKKEGFDLRVVSSFRGFEQQKNIWQRKAQGQKVLLDSNGHPLKFEDLEPDQIVDAILRWSAFPGASRHHWGTDVDVFDANAVAADYEVQLTPQEVAGVFAPFYSWIDELVASDDAEGFFLPYDQDRGGIAPEAWHLSYRPVAKEYEKLYSEDFFIKHVSNLNELALIDEVKNRASEIYARFISNVAS
ncbi:MAG: peptidase [Halobacteriovorax sp.]|nr:peptidase [Halobacteriovorax sp.]